MQNNFINCCKRGNSILLGVFYRPPSSGTDTIKELAKCLDLLNLPSRRKLSNVILTGDFNFPHIKWDEGQPIRNTMENEVTDSFLQVVENNFLFQHVEEATRITPTTSNILDLVFTTHPNAIFDVHIIPGISDHDAIVFTTHSCAKKQKYNARKMYQFSQADFVLTYTLLQ